MQFIATFSRVVPPIKHTKHHIWKIQNFKQDGISSISLVKVGAFICQLTPLSFILYLSN